VIGWNAGGESLGWNARNDDN